MRKFIAWWKSPAKKPYLHTKGQRLTNGVLEVIAVQLRAAEVRDLKKRVEVLEGKRPSQDQIAAYVDRKFAEINKQKLTRKQVVDLLNSGDDTRTVQ